MKQRIVTFMMGLVLLMSLPPCGFAANTKTTVEQVTTAVTIDTDCDYTVTSATPFGSDGVIDIANTEHAVVILSNVKPSAAIRLLAAHVTIDGKKAVNGTNCQVKIYNLGSIILPYTDKGVLTAYSEPDFGGTAVSSYGTGNSGGYMNTLTQAQLNNNIRSFKLKRGYMVTFSTLPGGRGYSRCFIAADKDVEMASLPAVLDRRISSYRVFKWYDTGKKQVANYVDRNAMTALNVQSSYDWGQGNSSMLPDFEWVPNHIYEDWPSSATIGGTSQSPHTKNNNEPRNSADDHPQDLTTILGNWENMMRTGLRLCSPASWDGSDYWNATGFLAEFLDSIDARGWRCDIIDLHCYWPEGNFGNIKNWVDKYKRPVWISEWCWGASWNSNGAFASGVTETQVKSALQRICTNLNNWNYVERYYYWNSERDPSKLYKNGKLTPAGEYYASMNSGVGYNGRYDFVPTTPRQYPPSGFTVTSTDGKTVVKWHDQNGEYNQLMELERKVRGGQWQKLADIEQKEQAANYSYTDEEAPQGAVYRVRITDLNGTTYYTNNDMTAGDAMTTDEGQTLYVGGNLLVNGDFDLGAYDWTSGAGKELVQPYFQVVPVGSIDGGSYLQAYGSSALSNAPSVKKYVALQPNTDYLFRVASCNGGANQQLNLSASENSAGTKKVGMKNTTSWNMQQAVFNSGDNAYALIALYNLQAKAQFDKIEIRQLFTNRDEAVADGMEQLRHRAKAVMAYNDNEGLSALNSELQQRLDALTAGNDEALAAGEAAVDELLHALADYEALDSLSLVVAALQATGVAMPDALQMAWAVAPQHYTASYFTTHRRIVEQALGEFLTYTKAEVQPKSPSFANKSSNGWEVKVGSYTGGDQSAGYVYGGKNCWNAWWANVSASQGTKQSMEIRQNLDDLPEGLYALECKASTQHYCLSDQHGYLIYNKETYATPPLKADYMDLPTVGNIWQTLTTSPVYIEEGSSVTIGFVGTKQGAIDNAYRPYGNTSGNGDRREGWWLATDFRLLYHPVKKLTLTPGQWSTVCLPYAFTVPSDMKLYQVAGLLADHTAIAIEEATQVEAGRPYICKSEQAQQVLLEFGDKVKSAVSYTQCNNLRGYFETSAANRAPVDSYVLKDGQWVVVGDERPSIASNSAIIFKLDGMTELDAWSGLTMPLSGAPTAIGDVGVEPASVSTFTLGGQRADGSRGIVIETDGRQAKKVVRK